MKKNTSKKLFNLAITSAMATGAIVAVAPAATEAAPTFKDVNVNSTHYSSITDLSNRGIINGYPDGTFKPNAPVQRNHTASILAGLLKLDTVNVTNPNFKDVPRNYPYYGSIAALQNAGIVSGYKDGTYGIKKNLTRGEMAAIIVRAFDLGGAVKTPFKDIANSPYKSAIEILYANNVAKGTSATTFNPKALVTRGEFASFVVRAEKVNFVPGTPSPTEPEPTEPTTPSKPTPTEPTTPTTPTTPTNPGSGSGGGSGQTEAQIKNNFVNTLGLAIEAAKLTSANQYVTGTTPTLNADGISYDINVEINDTTANVSNLKNLITRVLGSDSAENAKLASKVKIGTRPEVEVTEENVAALVAELENHPTIKTLGNLKDQTINLQVWVNGATTPLQLNLKFEDKK